MNMKAEYDGEQINIYDEHGDLVYEIPIIDLAINTSNSSTEFTVSYGAGFRDAMVSDALAELFDAKGDKIQKHVDYFLNYYNV